MNRKVAGAQKPGRSYPISVALVAVGRPSVLPTFQGAAGQEDDAEPQKGDDYERPRGARELPQLRRQNPLLLMPYVPTSPPMPSDEWIIASRGRPRR